MAMHSNEILLEHPSGANVLLVGTQHVSCTHGSRVSTVVERLRPSAVLLELDQGRFSQVDFRLRHLLHLDTSSLMEMTADTGAGSSVLQRLLPDALLWGQHMQQFALMRNEGVPLLLGSLYGADFLQAALAASALPEQATIVLADQQQQLTMARFKALTDTLGGLRQMLGSVFGTAHAEAYSCPQASAQQQQQQDDWQLGLSTTPLYQSTTSSHKKSMGLLEAAQQLQRIFTAAAQLAAGRMVHLCLEWWSMALTSQARWYGDNIHPVFLLVGNPELQQRLEARGCQGVAEAAAAAGRLLEVAAASSPSASSSSGSMVARGGLPAVEDFQAIRTFVSSLEGVMWSSAGQASAGLTGSSSSRAGSSTCSNSSTSGSSQVMHWLEQQPAGADAAGFSELMPLRPWWVTLSESFNHRLAQLSSPAADSSSSLSAALQSHQHANITAAAAYDQAVMAERNQVLTAALWQHTAAAAAEEAAAAAAAAASAGRSHTAAVGDSSGQQQQQHAAVVAVVGYNHLPGIVQLWRELQQQHERQQQAAGSSKYEGTFPGSFTAVGSSQHAFLPWQVTMTDAVAGVLELAAAGGAGLCYWAGINRWAPASAASATAAAAAAAGGSSSSGLARLAAKARSGPGIRRLGLLLLPAAVALLPLQRDAKRLQEAGGLLSKVAVVNDVILGQEARQLAHQQQQKCAGGGPSSSIMQLAYRAQAVAAAMP